MQKINIICVTNRSCESVDVGILGVEVTMVIRNHISINEVTVFVSVDLMRHKERLRCDRLTIVHDLSVTLAYDPHTTGYVAEPLKELCVVGLGAFIVTEWVGYKDKKTS